MEREESVSSQSKTGDLILRVDIHTSSLCKTRVCRTGKDSKTTINRTDNIQAYKIVTMLLEFQHET